MKVNSKDKSNEKKCHARCINYLCIVEGQQEELYINHLAKLLSNASEKSFKLNPKVGKLRNLEASIYTDYDSVFIFDHDFNTIEFERNLNGCILLNNNKQNKITKKKVYHAYSCACFDLWLILHKKDYNAPVTDAKGYVSEVRKVFNLDTNADIKNKKIINTILSQITIDDVKNAVERASKIHSNKLPSDAININGESYYPNPDFSIHKFINILLNQI